MSIPMSQKGWASGHVSAIELVQLCHDYPLKWHRVVLTGAIRFEMLAPEGTHHLLSITAKNSNAMAVWGILQ